MKRENVLYLAVFLTVIFTSGCGLHTPEVVISNGDPNSASILVNKIVNHVRCELKYAVRYTVWYDTQNALIQPDHKRRVPWIDKWGAKLALKLTLKEKSSVSPGVSLINPLSMGQSYTTGLGGSASSQATRTVNLDFFYDFSSEFLGKDFDSRVAPKKCNPPGNSLIDGDLKIAEFVDMATFPYYLPGNVSAKMPDATSQEIEFVIAADANLTPTWKLIRVSTSGGSTGMFDVNRTSTNDVIVSIGPAFGGVPSDDLKEEHFLAKQQSNFFSAGRP
jgi:hypothetical protein